MKCQCQQKPKQQVSFAPLNLESELSRIEFVIKRDGLSEGIVYAKRMYNVYRASALSVKKKFGKNANFRRLYVESAMSFRHFLPKLNDLDAFHKGML